MYVFASAIVLLFGTFSTTGFFGLAVVVVIMGIVFAKHFRRILGIVVLVALMTIAAATWVGWDFFANVMMARTTERVGPFDTPEQAAVDFIFANPHYALYGVGVGNTSFYSMEYVVFPVGAMSYLAQSTLPMASFLFTVITETGVIGLLPIIVFQITLLWKAVRLKRRAKRGIERQVIASCIGFCLGCLALEPFALSVWTFMSFGLLAAVIGLIQSNARRSVESINEVFHRLEKG